MKRTESQKKQYDHDLLQIAGWGVLGLLGIGSIPLFFLV
jgi:hypothetical protein